jgi:hypothetical protein
MVAVTVAVERQVSVIEAPPYCTEAGIKFFLATEQERREAQEAVGSQYIVRLATEEELESLNGKTWEQMEADAIAVAVQQHQ